MPRSAFNHRLAEGDPRHLRGARNAVHIGAQRDDRFAAAPAGPPGRRDIGNAVFYGKAIGAEYCPQITLSFELLKTELRKREQAVNDFLNQLCPTVDADEGFSLECGQVLLCGGGGQQQTG